MAAHYELKQDKNGQYMFNLKAGNNEIILTSESYTTKAAAEAGIKAVRSNAAADANYERKTAANNSPFFVLKSGANGQAVGKSEMYSSVQARDKGIQAVKDSASSTTVKEAPAAKKA